MYYLESDLSRREYLSELRRTFRNPFLIYDEHVCGIIIGPLFSIAYHSPHEWNRKVTGEINRAWGYVKDVDGKTYVSFIRGKGLLSPSWFLIYTAVFYAFFLFNLGHEPAFLWISLGLSLLVCLITAFQSIITDAGEAGFHEITRLLLNPKEYYG